MSQARSSLETYNVVISGMGLSGLATAWEALRRGKSVLMVEKHGEDYIRMNRTYLNVENRKSLLSMLAGIQNPDAVDKAFIQKVENNYSIAIKDTERFIKKQLDRFKDKIDYRFRSQLSAIDMQAGTLTIALPNGESKIQFDDVICADGTQHHAVNIYNASNPPEPITYTKLIKHPKKNLRQEPQSPYHLSAYIRITRNGQPLNLPEKNLLVMNDPQTNDLYFLHFNRDSVLNKQHPDTIKCHLICEIPQKLFAAMQVAGADLYQIARQQIETAVIKLFAKENIMDQISISLVKPSEKHGEQKDKLKLQCFQTNLMEANTAAIAVGSKRLILSGDTSVQPNYQIGHGAIDALIHAGWIGEIFDGKRTLADYTKEVKKQAAKMQDWGVTLFGSSFAADRSEGASTMEGIQRSQVDMIDYTFHKSSSKKS
jgi:hypothetical protein